MDFGDDPEGGGGTPDDNLQSMLGQLDTLDTDEIADMFYATGEDIIYSFLEYHDSDTPTELLGPLKERLGLAHNFARQYHDGSRVVEYRRADGSEATTDSAQAVGKALRDMTSGFREILKGASRQKQAVVGNPDRIEGRASEQKEDAQRDMVQQTANWVTRSTKETS
jgi:hypothetical protein